MRTSGHVAVVGQQRRERRGALGLAEDEDLPHRRAARGLARLLEERRDRHQVLGAGVAELEGELLGRVQRVRRGDHAADHDGAVKGQRVLGQVRAVDGEDVALGEAAARQAGRHPARPARHLGDGQGAPARAVDEHRPIGVLAGVPEDEGRVGQLGDRHVRDRAPKDHAGLVAVCVIARHLSPGRLGAASPASRPPPGRRRAGAGVDLPSGPHHRQQRWRSVAGRRPGA